MLAAGMAVALLAAADANCNMHIEQALTKIV
jgi:hypothetical protein